MRFIAYVNNHRSFFYHITADNLGTPDGCNENVCLASMRLKDQVCGYDRLLP